MSTPSRSISSNSNNGGNGIQHAMPNGSAQRIASNNGSVQRTVPDNNDNIQCATSSGGTRTFSIMGDSISTFVGCNPEGFHVFYEGGQRVATGVLRPEFTWWRQVIGHFGGTLLANGSFSGSMVQGEHFPAAMSMRRAKALTGSHGEAPDVIVVFIGINDYGWGTPEAQAAGRGGATPPELAAQAPERIEQAGAAPVNAAARFQTAYSTMLNNLKTLYPAAEIWCSTLCPGRKINEASASAQAARAARIARDDEIAAQEEKATKAANAAAPDAPIRNDSDTFGENGDTLLAPHPQFSYRFRGVAFDDYNEAIRTAAHEANCHVADMRAWGMDYEATDGTHPTARGMRQIAAMIAHAMERAEAEGAQPNEVFGTSAVLPLSELPASLLAEWNDPESWRSAIACNKTSCIGCPHATNTGNRWSLMCRK